MKFTLNKQTLTVIAACLMTFALSACGGGGNNTAGSSEQSAAGTEVSDESAANTDANTDKNTDSSTDINLDKLNDAADSIKNLDIDTDIKIGGNAEAEDKTDSADKNDKDTAENSAKEPEGEKTVYSYADVYRSGDDLTVVPNGGMNASAVLYGGKDLKGLLDYIDSDVLEESRVINRDFFYDILATMLVDKKLSSDPELLEKHMIMALALANNFYNMNVDIKDCYLDANNALNYHYNLTAYGKDDIWIVNYGDRTVFMNNGKTEYHSDMFKDEYLAVWLMAVDDYYGIR